MAIFRGFIAFDIKATPQILAFEEEIARIGADVKLVEPHNIHITMKFLGDTEEDQIPVIEQAMTSAVQGIKPFTLTLKGTGVFPNQNYIKVLWIGIVDDGHSSTLAQAIDHHLEPLGFPKEKKGFSPHLTIGRMKTAQKKDQLLKVLERYSTMEFTTQEVHSIALKKSELTGQGPIYTILREVPL
ncbi:MAG: RNA 2',3'-cyclic phosphodiesterase [Candidatus Thermoplasmatota archaeon]|nr:RNA 2',3'-cyclic phosphodiesterase [Candidatus Thermoplasmatota archaeon]